jgi:hypothetical protein
LSTDVSRIGTWACNVGTGTFSISEKKAGNTFESGFAQYGFDLDTASAKVSDDATIWSGLGIWPISDAREVFGRVGVFIGGAGPSARMGPCPVEGMAALPGAS